ncbi:MAG: DUF3127 domain-containing protein [Cytophagaceae bacterium]|nr:DUF3127 domain-containing protein [Cytophagaceae bacterium]
MKQSIQGKVVWKGEVTDIKDGTYKKTEFVIETDEQYPQSVLLTIFGKEQGQYGFKAESFNDTVNIGDTVLVEYDFKTTKYNDKYYNNINVWSFKKAGGSPSTVKNTTNATTATTAVPAPEKVDDDLPF